MYDFYEILSDDVDRIASHVHSQFPDLEYDDIRQEGWMYVYGSPEEVTRYLSETDKGRGYLVKQIKKRMHRWCSREMRELRGYDKWEDYAYTPSLVRELLPFVFFPEDWQPSGAKPDDLPRAKPQVNETGDRQAVLADISRALDHLTEDQYNAIVWRYKYRLTFDQLGEELGIARSSASDRVTRAVNRMALFLSEQDVREDDDPPREYTGGRHVVTNAAARSYQANQY